MPRMWFAQLPDPKKKTPSWVRVASNGRLNDADFARYQVRQTEQWFEVAADSTADAKAKVQKGEFVATCDASSAPVVRPSLVPRSAEDVAAADEKAPILDHSEIHMQVSSKVLEHYRQQVAELPIKMADIVGSRRADETEDYRYRCYADELKSAQDAIAQAAKVEEQRKLGAWVHILAPTAHGNKEWVLMGPDDRQYVQANSSERCDIRVRSGAVVMRYKLLNDSSAVKRAKQEALVLDHAKEAKATKRKAKEPEQFPTTNAGVTKPASKKPKPAAKKSALKRKGA